jgi:hypothetical protein
MGSCYDAWTTPSGCPSGRREHGWMSTIMLRYNSGNEPILGIPAAQNLPSNPNMDGPWGGGTKRNERIGLRGSLGRTEDSIRRIQTQGSRMRTDLIGAGRVGRELGRVRQGLTSSEADRAGSRGLGEPLHPPKRGRCSRDMLLFSCFPKQAHSFVLPLSQKRAPQIVLGGLRATRTRELRPLRFLGGLNHSHESFCEGKMAVDRSKV